MAEQDGLARDVETLRRLVQEIHELLQWVVRSGLPSAIQKRSRTDRLSVELLRELDGALPELNRAVQLTLEQLSAIRSTEDPQWRQLGAVGLTAQHLHWKTRLLNLIVRRRRPLRRLLRFSNNFLGSLAKVILNAELVKEYKEGLELFIERQRDLPDPPKTNLLRLAELGE